jgi:hypothetical protein
MKRRPMDKSDKTLLNLLYATNYTRLFWLNKVFNIKVGYFD